MLERDVRNVRDRLAIAIMTCYRREMVYGFEGQFGRNCFL